MFKTIVTLMRGSAAAAVEDLADANALLILDQQIRDARGNFGQAQRALAIALAENAQEERQMAANRERITALEQRARAALSGNREDLAADAAEAIAELEAELDAGEPAHRLFASQLAQMRHNLSSIERRLVELQRGRRLAQMAESLRIAQRGRVEEAGAGQATLCEAEATLARLRDRQMRAADAVDALDGIEAATRPETIEHLLADAGFGAATRPTAASVLARLKQA
jgi:phage shock protein A